MLLTRERTAKSQIGSQATNVSGSTYSIGGGDISFANGQVIMLRIPTILPRKAVINSATVKFNMVVKTPANAQSSVHRIWGHASGDSPMLIPGVNEWGARPTTTAVVGWTATWNANEDQTTPGGLVYRTVNITSIISELVNRADWVPGGYITLHILCDDETGSDMGVRANNDFQPSASVQIDYTEFAVNERVTFNMCENSEFGVPVQSIGTDGNTVPYWMQANYFGAFVDNPNLGTMQRDTSFTRLPGVPTLRFTCGTPPSDQNLRTGPSYTMNDNVNYSTVLCGWVFIPNGVGVTAPDDVFVGDPYRSTFAKTISQRGQWVPFCTDPDPIVGSQWGGRFFTVGLKNFTAGQQFWLSEPAIIRSDFRQMPFNGKSPARSPGIDHQATAGGMLSARVWTPKRYMKVGNSMRAFPSWIKRTDGIFQLAEPVKGA